MSSDRFSKEHLKFYSPDSRWLPVHLQYSLHAIRYMLQWSLHLQRKQQTGASLSASDQFTSFVIEYVATAVLQGRVNFRKNLKQENCQKLKF